MERLTVRLSRSRLGSILVTRRRHLAVVAVIAFILITLKLTEYDDDNKWLRRPGYSQMHVSSNGTMLNGTYIPNSPIIHIGDGYKRPGYELPLARGIPLRIMAVGASTTRGEKSHDNNGFRRVLRDRLVAIGNPVNYVGTDRVGNMTDNDVEAWPGTHLNTIRWNVEQHVATLRPNLYLANVGSNDCFQHFEIPDFYKRYHDFIHWMLRASPRATVVMGTLLPTTETERFNASDAVQDVNRQIRLLYKILRKEGKPVVLADMQGPTGIQASNLNEDGMHPTNAGYEMMGRIIFEAIVEADARGFLRPAENIDGIAADGDSERRDDAYDKWRAQQAKLNRDQKIQEEVELRSMTEAIAVYTAEMEAKKGATIKMRGQDNLAREVLE